jgi:hypothetical protein
MWRAVIGLFLLGLAPSASSQEVRLFGEGGTEAEITPANTSSLLNPGNILNTQLLNDSTDLTLFGSITSDDKRWKLQMKLRGSNDWQRDTRSRFEVSELSFKYSVASWLDLRIGREIEHWGTGYAWNPTGVVNPKKDPSDPGDRRSLFRGVDMAAADIFVHGWDITALGTPEIAWTGKDGRRLLSTGWATRAYRLIKGTDVAFTASGGNGLPNSQGLSLARVFGNALELHGEAAYLSDTVRYLPISSELVPVRRPHAEVLLGGQYTLRHNVNVVGELYHSGLGLNGREWNDFREVTDSARESLREGNPLPFMLANSQFTPLQMSKNYTFLRVLWPIQLNRLEIETIVISSLRDGSSLIQPGIRWRIGSHWRLYCIDSEFVGNANTEFGNIQIRRSIAIGIRYHFSLGERPARDR